MVRLISEGSMISTPICLCFLSSSSSKLLPVIYWWYTRETEWMSEMAHHCYWQRWQDPWVPTPERRNATLSYLECIYNRIALPGPWRPTPSRGVGLTAERSSISGSIWRRLMECWCDTLRQQRLWVYPAIVINNGDGSIDFQLLKIGMWLSLLGRYNQRG